MRKPLYSRFVDKAQAALIAAVEVYNKPAFTYREETFLILAVNAWELILKARILQLHKNKLGSIRAYSNKKTKSGGTSRRRVVKTNRSGTAMTIGLFECVSSLESRAPSQIPNSVRRNLEALCEVRDGSVQYVHASDALARQVLTIAAASVKNFVLISKDWFGVDIGKHISLMLPLAFVGREAALESVVVSKDESRLMAYLAQLAAAQVDEPEGYFVAMSVDIKFNRSKLESAIKVQMSNDPTAVKVTLTEEDIRARYPWDYQRLTDRLSQRYSNFSTNAKYHSLRKLLSKEDKFARDRFLDPGNAQSSRKTFYSETILSEFDKYYARRDP